MQTIISLAVVVYSCYVWLKGVPHRLVVCKYIRCQKNNCLEHPRPKPRGIENSGSI